MPDESTEFTLSAGQARTLEVLVDLIGLSGVSKRPEQGDAIVLDLLPAEHTMGNQPFCVRIPPNGSLWPISDEEAGLGERPDMLTAMRERNKELRQRLNEKWGES